MSSYSTKQKASACSDTSVTVESDSTKIQTTTAVFQSNTATISHKRTTLSPNSDDVDMKDKFNEVNEKRMRHVAPITVIPVENSDPCDNDANFITGREPKFFVTTRRKVVYSHNWAVKDDNEGDKSSIISTSPASTSMSMTSRAVSGRGASIADKVLFTERVKQAQQCADAGELDDFRQELDYILSTLLDSNSAQNLKHLSAIQLAKKCILAEFRRFLRSQNILEKIFAALDECQGSLMIALTTAAIIYVLARDQKSIPITDTSIRLIADLLRHEPNQANCDDKFKRHRQQIWSILCEWLNRCAERTQRAIHFGVTESTLSASLLTLEALAYVSIRENNEFFKTELLNSGCLQWVVAKLDKTVLKLSYSPIYDGVLQNLEEIERCFRILENAAAFNKKNQAYLINHRNGLLLETGVKFLNYFTDYAEKFELSSLDAEKNDSTERKILNELLECTCLLSRVLMNVSHENELCSKKLGQKDGFLYNCINILTNTAPRIVSKEKFFDVSVMMYGLLVNLVERCDINRQKMLELNITVYNADTKTNVQTRVLDALTMLFMKHDVAARTLDEELDNELAFDETASGEDADESSNQGIPSITSTSASGSASSSQEDASDNGRLRRRAELSEDAILNAVQGAMNKASAHMEDSMLASYSALLVGCIVQHDQNLAEEVKALLPEKKLTVMIEQLERFLDFMKLTKMKQGSTRSIERIVQSMQLLQ